MQLLFENSVAVHKSFKNENATLLACIEAK